MSYPKSETISNGVQTDASQYNNLRLDALSRFDYLVNNSGVLVDEGSVCVFDASVDNGFKRTTLAGDPSVIGVVVSPSIAAGASGYLSTFGLHTVKVSGNVVRGNWLIASDTAGYAKDSGSTQRPAFGAIGVAMTAFTGATGTVTARLSVVHYTSNALLQLLGSATPVIGTASFTTSVTVPSGTDLLVVAFASKKASTTGLPTAMTFDGTAMTIYAAEGSVGSSYYGSGFAVLRLPTIGAAKTLSITAPASAEINAAAFGFVGSMASIARTRLGASMNSATTVSQTPDSVLGDLVLDVLCTNVQTVWTPNAGQTIIRNDVSKVPQLLVTIKPGAAGTTSMGATGASTYGFYSAMALKGS